MNIHVFYMYIYIHRKFWYTDPLKEGAPNDSEASMSTATPAALARRRRHGAQQLADVLVCVATYVYMYKCTYKCIHECINTYV